MSETKKNNIYEFMSYSIILLNAFLMLLLCRTDNLWYDESYTIALIIHPIRELIDITSNDVHSPFYYLLLKGFYNMLGHHIQAAKIFSVIFLVLFLINEKYFVSAVYDKKSALYSLLLLLSLPSVTVHAADVRMYTMGLFFVGLSSSLAYYAIKNSKLKLWAFFTVSCICTMYVHIFTMIAMFILFLLMALCIFIEKYRNKTSLLCYLGGGTIAVISYIPWLLIVFKQLENIQSSNLSTEINHATYVNYFVQWFSSSWNPDKLTIKVWCCGLALTGIIYLCGLISSLLHKRLFFFSRTYT